MFTLVFVLYGNPNYTIVKKLDCIPRIGEKVDLFCRPTPTVRDIIYTFDNNNSIYITLS